MDDAVDGPKRRDERLRLGKISVNDFYSVDAARGEIARQRRTMNHQPLLDGLGQQASSKSAAEIASGAGDQYRTQIPLQSSRRVGCSHRRAIIVWQRRIASVQGTFTTSNFA
jgi:hypothetical protein